jgi:hypothetical protein
MNDTTAKRVACKNMQINKGQIDKTMPKKHEPCAQQSFHAIQGRRFLPH